MKREEAYNVSEPGRCIRLAPVHCFEVEELKEFKGCELGEQEKGIEHLIKGGRWW